jgi:hypothetical protein
MAGLTTCRQNILRRLGIEEAGQNRDRDRRPHLIGIDDARPAIRFDCYSMRRAKLHPTHRCAEQDLRPCLPCNVSERTADLPIPAARIEEATRPRRLQPRHEREDLARHLAQGSSGNATHGLHGREILGWHAPNLERIWKVEVSANRGSEAPLHDTGEVLVRRWRGSCKHLAHRITRDAERERPRHAEGEVEGLQREMNPPPAQTDAPVPWTVEEIVAEEGANVRQDVGPA